jgi:hypothetical protein
VQEAGIPVPRTKIMKMPSEAQKVVWKWFDGQQSNNQEQALLNNFIEELRIAALDIGFPIFLRTDHTSAKHGWDDTCFVKSPDMLGQHVFQIAEFSEIADMIGIPWDTWVVREFLPTIPVGVSFGCAGLILEIEIAECLSALVANDEAGVVIFLRAWVRVRPW